MQSQPSHTDFQEIENVKNRARRIRVRCGVGPGAYGDSQSNPGTERSRNASKGNLDRREWIGSLEMDDSGVAGSPCKFGRFRLFRGGVRKAIQSEPEGDGGGFHHLQGDQVAVRLNVGWFYEIYRFSSTQIGVLLPIPSRLRSALARASARHEGFLMTDAKKLVRDRTTRLFTMGKQPK